MTSERILIADDTPVNIRLLTEALEPRGYEILAASSGEQCLKIAERAQPHVIILDVIMPDCDGFFVCRALKKNPATRQIPVLFVSARDETESLLRGFRDGAVDYISKPFQAEEVIVRVQTHLKLSRLCREILERNRELEAEIERREAAEAGRRIANARLNALSEQEAQRWGLSAFVGRSALVRSVLADIRRLHQFSNTNVLITGESGTGKELVARAIHFSSPRAQAPFIPVNCVAIPSDLAESTLFGHLKGSFTGALAERKGWFELADGGTLFLDEIGDMPSGLQAKLLRVLEDGEITPVGASRCRRVDVRVVAATNADLEKKMADGKFRQDLYFRLARYTVEMPALRQRSEDVPLLANHFLEIFAREMGITGAALTPEAMDHLAGYQFPGNVRELKNIIERALIESGGEAIEPVHLHFMHDASRRIIVAQEPATDNMTALPLNLDAAEQALIQRALRESGGNVAEAARMLGVNRSRIYRRFHQPTEARPD
ncbi:MAG TPA: sigma-54 dependent transcriptional regulator [Terrimicrobiaceae bacterium]